MAAFIALRLSQTHETVPLSRPCMPDVPQVIGVRSRRYVAVAFLPAH